MMKSTLGNSALLLFALAAAAFDVILMTDSACGLHGMRYSVGFLICLTVAMLCELGMATICLLALVESNKDSGTADPQIDWPL